MAELRRFDRGEVELRLASLGDGRFDRATAQASRAVDELRWQLRASVAFEESFESGAVSDLAGDPARLATFLAEDCERVRTGAGRRWRLVAEVRAAVLDRAGGSVGSLLEDAATGDPAAAPRPTLQAAKWIIEGTLPALRRLSLTELRSVLQAAAWLAPTGMNAPEPDALLAEITRQEVLQPLLGLVDDDFIGRKDELRLLREHLLGRHPIERLPVLALAGPGGVGKSTLLAHAVLRALSEDSRTPDPVS